MVVEREGRSTPEEGSEFIKLYEELKEHHRVSMLMNNGSDELAGMSDAEQDKWYDDGLSVMRSISKVSGNYPPL